ncbi:MAG: tRNA (cytidine(34)-2'-O)-methyltransferase [Hyphomicrobiaceae bacterium]|nr:tRNA (cytidine(34)-2'-O)-methyltransferase [Hyphomicrobiaceae bacterium]
MRIALYQPDIPQNTGTILRLAACMNVTVDIIGPAGFDLSDRAFRRSGMDYIEHANFLRHINWQSFQLWRSETTVPQRLLLLTTTAQHSYVEFFFQPTDILLFGSESAGVTDEIHNTVDKSLTIPMHYGFRSLNLAVSVAMVLGEALRQNDSFVKP